MNLQSGVKKAVKEAGSKSALARALGLKVQSIQQWKRIPAEQVANVERATGLSRHVLRPDLYPADREPPVPSVEARA